METRKAGLIYIILIIFAMGRVTGNNCHLGNHVDSNGKMKWVLHVEEPCTEITPGGYNVRQMEHGCFFLDRPFFSTVQQTVNGFIQQFPSDGKVISPSPELPIGTGQKVTSAFGLHSFVPKPSPHQHQDTSEKLMPTLSTRTEFQKSTTERLGTQRRVTEVIVQPTDATHSMITQTQQDNVSTESEKMATNTKQYPKPVTNRFSTIKLSSPQFDSFDKPQPAILPGAAAIAVSSDRPYSSISSSSGTASSSHTFHTDDTTTASICPPEWIPGDVGVGDCYLFQDTRLPWVQARTECHSLGGHFVFIESDQENAFIATRLARLSGLYWIGLNDIVTEGSWMWEDAKNVTGFTNWGNESRSLNNSDKNCGRIRHDNLKWYDILCEHTMSYICEMQQ